jgi:hypothetical protein
MWGRGRQVAQRLAGDVHLPLLPWCSNVLNNSLGILKAKGAFGGYALLTVQSAGFQRAGATVTGSWAMRACCWPWFGGLPGLDLKLDCVLGHAPMSFARFSQVAASAQPFEHVAGESPVCGTPV